MKHNPSFYARACFDNPWLVTTQGDSGGPLQCVYNRRSLRTGRGHIVQSKLRFTQFPECFCQDLYAAEVDWEHRRSDPLNARILTWRHLLSRRYTARTLYKRLSARCKYDGRSPFGNVSRAFQACSLHACLQHDCGQYFVRCVNSVAAVSYFVNKKNVLKHAIQIHGVFVPILLHAWSVNNNV